MKGGKDEIFVSLIPLHSTGPKSFVSFPKGDMSPHVWNFSWSDTGKCQLFCKTFPCALLLYLLSGKENPFSTILSFLLLVASIVERGQYTKKLWGPLSNNQKLVFSFQSCVDIFSSYLLVWQQQSLGPNFFGFGHSLVALSLFGVST